MNTKSFTVLSLVLLLNAAIPSLAATSNCPADYASTEQTVNFPEQMVNKYLHAKWNHMPEYHDSIRKFLVTEYFSKPEFQRDPVAVLTAAVRERGGLQMLVIPSDPAIDVLKQMYQRGELVDFARQIKLSGGAASAVAEVGHYPASVKAAVSQASAERPVHLRVTLPKSDEAEALDDSFLRLGLNPERTSNGSDDTILITVNSPRQAEVMDQLMDMMEGQVKSTSIARDITKRAPALPANLSGAVNKALATASKEKPVYIDLGVSGVDDADDMDKALRAAGFKVKGYGFPLESNPPQGSRTVVITNEAEAQRLRDIMAKYQDAIGDSHLRNGPKVTPQPRNLSRDVYEQLENFSAEKPVTLTLGVRATDRADNMDSFLKSIDSRVEGNGFPLESNPPQGSRTITIRDPIQAERFLESVNIFENEISHVSLKNGGIAAPKAAASSSLPRNLPAAVRDAMDKATAQNPVQVRLGVYGTDDASMMDRALSMAFGSKVEGRGFPLESMPPQGSRMVTITSKEDADKLQEIMSRYQSSIGGAKVAERAAPRFGNLTVELGSIMEKATADHPVTLTLNVAQTGNSAAMDRALLALRDSGAKVEGNGFPLESMPRQGTRTVTLSNRAQAEKLRELMAANNDSITGSSLAQARVATKPVQGTSGQAQAFLNEHWPHMKDQHESILRFLNDNYLSNPNFLENPREFVVNALRARGGSEELRMPGDAALSFMERLQRRGSELEEFAARVKTERGPVRPAPASQPAIEPKTMEQAYLDKTFSHMDKDAIKVYSNDHYYSKESFLNNPNKFVDDARRARGGTEEFRGNSDAALSFMEELQRNGELESFATKLKATRAIGPALKVDAVEDAFLKGRWSHMPEYHQDIKLYLNDNYYSKPEFLEDPEKFLEEVIRKRGGTEELRIPADPAQAFMEDLARKGKLKEFAQNVKANRPAPVPRPVEVQEVGNLPKAQMKSYLDSKWGHMKEHHKSIEDYLEQNYFSNPEFLGDPKGFFERNGRRQSRFDLLAVPQDPANRFIEEMYRKGELEEFVKKLKAANPGLNANVPVYSNEVKSAVAVATESNPVHLRLTMPKSDIAEDMDDSLKRLNLNPERTTNGNTDTVLITVSNANQARIMDQLMDVYKGNLTKAELARDITKRAPGLPRNLPSKVNEALKGASKERPVIVDLGVRGTEEADDMDKALRSAGFKMRGYGFPLESMPPQGSRTVVITNEAEAKKLRDIMAKYTDSIGGSRLRDKLEAIPKPQNLSDSAYQALDKASAENPVTLTLNVRATDRADNMDYFLKGVDPKVKGNGFPLESNPPQGSRELTFTDSFQVERFLDSMDVFRNEIGRAELKTAGSAAASGATNAVKALPRSMTAEVRAALDKATKDAPVMVSLGVRGVDNASAMDAALIALREQGLKVEGQGFPLESMPPQGGRQVTVYSKEQGDKLQEVMSRYPQAIGSSRAEVVAAARKPDASKASMAVISREEDYLKGEWGHMPDQHARIQNYLNDNYYSKPEFLNNPKKFVEDATRARGGSEELRMPSDAALSFMQDLMRNGDLESFAANMRVVKGQPAASSSDRKQRQLDKLQKWNKAVRGSSGARNSKEDPAAEQLRQLEEAKKKRLERLQKWNEQIRKSESEAGQDRVRKPIEATIPKNMAPDPNRVRKPIEATIPKNLAPDPNRPRTPPKATMD